MKTLFTLLAACMLLGCTTGKSTPTKPEQDPLETVFISDPVKLFEARIEVAASRIHATLLADAMKGYVDPVAEQVREKRPYEVLLNARSFLRSYRTNQSPFQEAAVERAVSELEKLMITLHPNHEPNIR